MFTRNFGFAVPLFSWMIFVVAACSGGDGPRGPGGTVAPTTPTSPSATALSTTSIRVSWNDTSSNELGFLIDRAPDLTGVPGAFVQVGTTVANVESFDDTGLTENTSYWYRVHASNDAGASPLSIAVLGTTDASDLGPQWWKTYADGQAGLVLASAASAGDAFLLSGSSEALLGQSSETPWLVKVDAAGEPLWQRTYSTFPEDVLADLAVAADGSAVTLIRDSIGSGPKGLLAVDAGGMPEWHFAIGGIGYGALSAGATSDEVVLSGSTNQASPRALLIRIDRDGSVRDSREVVGIDHGFRTFGDVAFTQSGEAFLCGWSRTSLATQIAATVVKLDAEGDVVWAQQIVGPGSDSTRADAIEVTQDGGAVVFGWYTDVSAQSSAAWALRLDASGAVLWQHVLPAVTQVSIVFYRWTMSSLRGDRFVVPVWFWNGVTGAGLYEFDASGSTLAAKTYGGLLPNTYPSGVPRLWDVATASTNGLLLCGSAVHPGSGDHAVVLRADLNGNCGALSSSEGVVAVGTTASVQPLNGVDLIAFPAASVLIALPLPTSIETTATVFEESP